MFDQKNKELKSRKNIIVKAKIKSQIMNTNKYATKKRLGQNFLKDRSIINQLVNLVNPNVNDFLIEIGPGLAALTKPLLNKVNRLTAVELDRDLLPYLSQIQGLTVIHHDALKFNFLDYYHSQINSKIFADHQKIRLVGNLPYNISTPLIFHFLSFKDIFQDMHFMLQKEVVERICASPNSSDYGRLSVMVQRHCQASALIDISPLSFDPPPKVMSQFVQLIPREKYHILDEALFDKIVRYAFMNRRKMLRNNLKGVIDDTLFALCHIDPKMRAENLSVDDFVNLANQLKQFLLNR